MLFDGFKLTPRGEQLLEIKALDQIKFGKVIIKAAEDGDNIKAADAPSNMANVSACVVGVQSVAKSQQLNIRIHANKDGIANLKGKLRMIIFANEAITAATDPTTEITKYSAHEEQDAMVFGYVDSVESDATGGDSTSATGIVFDAVVTVKGTAKSRCNLLDVMRCPYLMNGAVSNADLKRHNLADESISAHDETKEAVVAVASMEERVTPEAPAPAPKP